MNQSTARLAVDVAAICAGALIVVSTLTHDGWLMLAGVALFVACGGMLSYVRED